MSFFREECPHQGPFKNHPQYCWYCQAENSYVELNSKMDIIIEMLKGKNDITT